MRFEIYMDDQPCHNGVCSKRSSILTCLFTQEECVAICITYQLTVWLRFVVSVIYSVRIVVGLLNIFFMNCVKRKFLLFVAVEGESDCDTVKVRWCK